MLHLTGEMCYSLPGMSFMENVFQLILQLQRYTLPILLTTTNTLEQILKYILQAFVDFQGLIDCEVQLCLLP